MQIARTDDNSKVHTNATDPTARNPRTELAAAETVVVPESLEAPHKTTQIARRELQAAWPDKYGALKCEDPRAFPIRVMENSVDRALLIQDTIVKSCIAAGFKVVAGEGGRARFVFGGGEVSFSIEETANRRGHKATPAERARLREGRGGSVPVDDWVPSGELRIILHGVGARTFRDLPTSKLEQRLGEVVAAMRQVVAADRAAKDAAVVREEALRREENRRATLRATHEKEKAALEALERDAERWARAEKLRAYLAALEVSGRDIDLAWHRWAWDQADRIDPLTESEPSVLDLSPKELRSPSSRDWSDF